MTANLFIWAGRIRIDASHLEHCTPFRLRTGSAPNDRYKGWLVSLSDAGLVCMC